LVCTNKLGLEGEVFKILFRKCNLIEKGGKHNFFTVEGIVKMEKDIFMEISSL